MQKPAITGGWAQDLFLSDQNLTSVQCAVCTNLLKEPVALPCNHSFCRECIGRWISDKENKHEEVTCPMCRSAFQGHCDFKIAQETNNIIMKCRRECGWTGNMNEEQKHFQQDCSRGQHVVIPSCSDCWICHNALQNVCMTCEAIDQTEPCICAKFSSCNHKFHSHCICRWMRTRDICPICNVKLDNMEPFQM